MTKKNKALIKLSITMISILLSIAAMITSFLFLNQKEINFVDQLTVEFGNSIPMKPKEYLQEKVSSKIISDIKLKIINDTKIDNESYQPIGNYIVSLSYKNQQKNVKVSVVDTTNPEFKEFKEKIEITAGASIDVKNSFQANDLSDVKIEVDDSNVDYNTTGEYQINIKAIDAYGNITSKQSSVVVKEMPNEINEVKTNNTPSQTGKISNKTNSTNNTSNNTKISNIPSEKTISLTQCGLRNPAYINFGQYQDYAVALYNAIINKENYYFRFEFPDTNEASGFLWKVRNEMETAGVALNSHLYVEYGTLQPDGLYSKNKYGVQYSFEETKAEGDLYYELSMAYNACVSAGLYNGMSEKDAVIKIGNWIKNHMIYDDNYHSAQSSYRGFKDGRGVCATYATMFKAMCDAANIKCEVVHGTAKGPHAWNKVKIGGTWYWSDITWYDTDGGDDKYLLSSTLWNSHSTNGIIQ